VVGVDVADGPVAEVERGNGNGGGVVIVVVGAFGVGGFVDEKGIAGSGAAVPIFEDGGPGVLAVFGIAGGCGADVLGEKVADVGDEGGE
jgi:hypothetical protein